MNIAPDPKLAILLKQREHLNKRIRSAQARQRIRRKKDDTRRKIIVGAIIKRHMRIHPQDPLTIALREIIAQNATRPKDRDLLGLPPLQQTNEKQRRI